MQQTQALNPKYIVNKNGHKKAVVLSVKDYETILDLIEDLEDANDLLKAEREATSFIPYEQFRKSWIAA
jgi:PHD/YefM family antitoxin component YafN of YafNO toxin-antitoxin module